MPFCPNCETHYKGQLSICPECGEQLIESAIDEIEGIPEAADDHLISLHRSPSEEESEILRKALRQAGIGFVFKQSDSIYDSGAFDGEFCVDEDDYDEAREVAESVLDDIEDKPL